MKKPAQIICSLLSFAIIMKSFFKSASAIDAINLIALVGVYCMYEFLNEKSLVNKVNELEKAHSIKIDKLEKDLNDTKNYVSKVSTSLAFRK